ncbi:hypothetical protein HanPSC8_Chr15g0678371 [Helianthus annuus]|nr:hypothetical protein HanPSC8_Chr15g0678371 [Helianthus annuus]
MKSSGTTFSETSLSNKRFASAHRACSATWTTDELASVSNGVSVSRATAAMSRFSLIDTNIAARHPEVSVNMYSDSEFKSFITAQSVLTAMLLSRKSFRALKMPARADADLARVSSFVELRILMIVSIASFEALPSRNKSVSGTAESRLFKASKT